MLTLEQLCGDLSDNPNRDMDTHLLTLYSIARFTQARRIVEIGVDDGSSTMPLLLAAAQNGGTLFSIDPAPCPKAHDRVEASGYQSCWTFINARSEDAAERFPEQSLDLVLVDGDHSEAGVRADWNLYSRRLRLGGMLLLHDVLNTQDFPGIQKVVDFEIRRIAGWDFECATLPYGWGLTITRRLR